MESALVVLLLLNLVFNGVTIIIGLLVGSVVVRIMDVLGKLPDEVRNPVKKDGPPDRPWYTYF